MNFLFLLLYFILILIGISNHEMWRDELEAWLISLHSTSLVELLHNIRYECHPPLLYLFFYVIGKFTRNPLAIQYFHLIIACAVIYIFLKFSPFTNPQKILFSFSYFPLYEYGVISRNYSLGLLFLFIACVLFKPKEKNYVLISVILVLLSSSHVYAMFIAFGFEIMLLLDYVIVNKNNLFFRMRNLVSGLLVFICGVTFLILQLSLPEDCFYRINWTTSFDISQLLTTLGTVWKGYFPLPALIYNFCDTNILNMINNLFIENVSGAILGLIILLFSIYLFRKNPPSLFLYLSVNFFILLFSYMRFYGSLRHHGSLFILFLACLWISAYSEKPDKFKNLFFNILLFCHLFSGTYAYTIDLFNPFSESKAAAAFIKEHNLENLTILGSQDFRVSPITAYLDKEIFYPESNRYETFIKWDKKAGLPTELHSLFRKSVELVKQRNEKVLLILSDELIIYNNGKPMQLNTGYLLPDIKILKIAGFSRAIRKDENYYIYLIESVNKHV